MKRVAAVPDRTLENFFKTLATLLIGVALGLFATYMAVERGYGFGRSSRTVAPMPMYLSRRLKS